MGILSDLSTTTLFSLVLAVGIALAFEFVNGFHDTAKRIIIGLVVPIRCRSVVERKLKLGIEDKRFTKNVSLRSTFNRHGLTTTPPSLVSE